MTYEEFFAVVIGGAAESSQPAAPLSPYAYQRDLAAGPWPEMLDVPTGLGKTAAITGAWLYRRLTGDASTPRRLMWCLPMRVLVEQTREVVDSWLVRARPLFEERGLVVPGNHVLMGGEADGEWVIHPERPAVLVGTQDMLLSRALMRGYGASRYRWPVDFALLHNDALWVFDEVQLMGAGLATSAQLEAFRRAPDMPLALPAHTLWASATLRPDWLATVDFRRHVEGCRVQRLPDRDRRDPRVLRRLSAPKRLIEATARLASSKKADAKGYIGSLRDEIIGERSTGAPTLVIVNRVARAQDLYQALQSRLARDRSAPGLLLVHSRFRAAERAALNVRLRGMRPDDDIIIVATQAVEAGVDITSRDLFTELAPWASLVQRFGRCNRGGEYDDAAVRWIDIDGGADTNLPLPYTVDALASARAVVRTLGSASPSDLPPVTDRNETPHVLRRKDLLDLFDTEPDLSGFDIDVSPYLRDPGGVNVDVFWREFERPDDQPRPHRRELCPVPIGAARDHVKAMKRAYIWNSLAAKWESISHGDLRPGQVLMLHSAAGGYDAEVGFVSGSRTKVSPSPEAATSGEQSDSMDADPDTVAGTQVELTEHLLAVHREAVALAASLPMAGAADAVTTAALWHDTGKAHPAFQTAILAHAAEAADRTRLWAKSADTRRRLDYGLVENGELRRRRFFRHEVASMLAWLEAGSGGESTAEGDDAAAAIDADLVAYLIAAHHGKVRLALRALPKENRPPDDRLYARGVWDGDTLPPIAFDGVRTPPLTLRLDLMQLGESDMGASWSTRTARLLSDWGPFRLAWLETMVRLADWRGSSRVRQTGGADR